jgi:hypothetical protein
MKNVIELNEKCPSCKGTGLYVGMGERDGAAVVCNKCRGTGCFKYKHAYEDFLGRVHNPDVKRVYRANPGICIGEGKTCKLADFGGIPYKEWVSGVPFTPGTEDRAHTCPSWFYQSADYKLKPEWDECFSALGYTFSRCPHFATKELCWKRWDAEFNGGIKQ